MACFRLFKTVNGTADSCLADNMFSISIMESLLCIVFILYTCSCEALQNTHFGMISHLVYFSNLVSSFLGQISLPSYFMPWVPAIASLQLPASNLSPVGSILHIVARVILNCKSGVDPVLKTLNSVPQPPG